MCLVSKTWIQLNTIQHDILIEDLIIGASFPGVTLFGGQRACKELNIPQAHTFHHGYNSMACTVEIVDDEHAAIDHIHQHGRHVDVSFFPTIMILAFPTLHKL